MYYIAYGRLKNAFRDWTECLDHIREALKRKRQEVMRRFAGSTAAKFKLSFDAWRNWILKELKNENQMKAMVNKMMKKAGLMQ